MNNKAALAEKQARQHLLGFSLLTLGGCALEGSGRDNTQDKQRKKATVSRPT